MQRSIQEDLPLESEAGNRTSIDSVEEIRQYIVYIQDDGTLLLDKKGVLPSDADPSCVLPLRLPLKKLTDPDDPIPGTVHVSYRQGTQDLVEPADMRTLLFNSQTGEVVGGATRLDENDLEWVQIIPKVEGQESDQTVQIFKKEEEEKGIPAPETVPAVSSDTSETPTNTLPSTSTSVTVPDSVPPSVASPAASTPPVVSAPEPQKPTPQANVSARARRSLRQADRAEKMEAERILAENKQMLQREKEQMENLKLPLNTVTPSGHVVGIAPAAAPPPPADIKKESPEDVANKKNPKRTRKLPAHLTDPNYIHPLDDDQPEDLKDAEDEDAEEPEEDVDDPNKLWCICRRPHNNRFMIQCDSCEDWFHGKCVGVTKAQGNVIEESEMQWHCPSCKKKLKDQEARNRLNEKKGKSFAKTPEIGKSARNSTASRERTPTGDRKNDQDERRLSTVSPDIVDAVKKERTNSTTKNEDSSKKPKSTKPESNCITCGTVTRGGSTFCSNKCVMEKASNNVREEQEQKKKKELEKKDSAGDSFLSFHKLKSSKEEEVSSSTEKNSKPVMKKTKESMDKLKAGKPVVKTSGLPSGLPKVSSPKKLATPSSSVKPSNDTESASGPSAKKKVMDSEKLQKKDESQEKTLTPKPKQPATPDAKGSAQKVPLQKQKSVEERTSKPQLPPKVAESQQRRDSSKITTERKMRDPTARTPTGTQPKSGNSQLVRSTSKQDEEKSRDDQKAKKATVEQKSSSQKSKEEPQKQPQHRPSLERKKSDTPSSSSLNSEPLLRQNMKRSLQAILQEKLKEAKTADATIEFKSNPETLAVEIEQELMNLFGTAGNPKCKTKFRTLLFNLKNTRSTLATSLLAQSLPPFQLVRMDSSEMAPAELTEWRQRESQRELEAIKRSELDKLTEAKKQELIEKGKEMDVVSKVAVVARQELEGVIPEPEQGKSEKPSTEEKKEDKPKSSKKKKHHRDRDRGHHRHREESSSTSSRDKTQKTKGPDKDTKIETDGRTKTEKSLKRSSPALSEEPKSVWPELPLKEKKEGQFSLTSVRELSPSLPELPSSTIKTPDFSPPQTTSLNPLFKTTLIMPELGTLNAALFHVSHPQLEGTLFPESPVPIVGRIPPETVWDYVDKMKKSKELIVLRLAPATPQDADAYMTFFSYLASRGRLGVLGGIFPPLKDVYLVPLDKHSPVNRSLLPFHGPGLPAQRAHCLLAVVVVTRAVESGQRPRVEVRHSKKPKLEHNQPKQSERPEPPPTSTEDEDKPYEPWEEEDDVEVPFVPSKDVTDPEEDKVAEELRKLNEQIAREKQEIESILVATSRNVDLAKVGGIPGLDGEFDDADSEPVVPGPSLVIIPLKEKHDSDCSEMKASQKVDVDPVEIIEEKVGDRTASTSSKVEIMEIDESSPSPVTIADSPLPSPEPLPPGLDDFRPLKKQPVEELSDELFEGTTLKQSVGKKIEINIKGIFPPAEKHEKHTLHGDIDERQLNQKAPDVFVEPHTEIKVQSPLGGIPTTLSSPLKEIPLPSVQPALPIDISVPPPRPFFLPTGPPPGLPPPSHQLPPPGFPMAPMGAPILEKFPMVSQPPPPLPQQGFSGSFPPASGTPSFEQRTEFPSSSTRPEKIQSADTSASESNWDDSRRPERESRSTPDAQRRYNSPRFGSSGGYRQSRGEFHGRVYRNPGGERGRWENDQRRYNRERDRDRSPVRRDTHDRRDGTRRDRFDSRRHRKRSQSPLSRRRSRSPSPRRKNRSRSKSPRRRLRSPSPRRRSKSPSPRRPRHDSKSSSPKPKTLSPRTKSSSPHRDKHSSRTSSTSSGSK